MVGVSLQTKSAMAWLFCGLTFLLNPQLACSDGSSSEDFDYTEQEMQAAVLGEWAGVADLQGEQHSFTLVLEQASSSSETQGVAAPKIKPQCGSRSFVKPAAACISTSNMPVVGTLTSDAPQLNGQVTGEIQAHQSLDSIFLNIEVETGALLFGSLAQARVAEGRIDVVEPSGTFTLGRP